MSGFLAPGLCVFLDSLEAWRIASLSDVSATADHMTLMRAAWSALSVMTNPHQNVLHALTGAAFGFGLVGIISFAPNNVQLREGRCAQCLGP